MVRPLSHEDRSEAQRLGRQHRQRLEPLRGQCESPHIGFFGPASVCWRINREPGLLLGGLRALALQFAHPAVAAGVVQASGFRQDVLGRLRRTFANRYEIIFGDVETAIQASQRVFNLHNHVRGVVPAEVSTPYKGQPYQANSPDLLMWVHATLVDTALVIYEALCGEVGHAEKAQYYAENKVVAVLSGLPWEDQPATLEDFYTYWEDMLNGPELEVGPTARGLMQELFNLPLMRTRIDEVLTAGLLPSQIREAYHLPGDDKNRRRHDRLIRTVRTLYRTLPPFYRAVPAYHQALIRLSLHAGQRPSRYGRFINWIDQHYDLFFSLRPISAVRESGKQADIAKEQ
jgi:uncharacterized protein (DUF2236 family)